MHYYMSDHVTSLKKILLVQRARSCKNMFILKGDNGIKDQWENA